VLNGAPDTVKLFVRISVKGTMVSESILGGNKGSALHQTLSDQCFIALQPLKHWAPAYVELVRREKFKGTIVLKPYDEKVVAEGVVSVVFSEQ